MDERDLTLRNTTYQLIGQLGRIPLADEAASSAGRTAAEVRAGWRRLQDEHALVVGDAGELLMASPFAAAPTGHQVLSQGRRWHANCAWDAFGVCAALDADGVISTQCPDCGDVMVIGVQDGQADDAGLLFHCLVPAAQWYDDIVFT